MESVLALWNRPDDAVDDPFQRPLLFFRIESANDVNVMADDSRDVMRSEDEIAIDHQQMCAIGFEKCRRERIACAHHAIALADVKLNLARLLSLKAKQAMAELRYHLLVNRQAQEQFHGTFRHRAGPDKLEDAAPVFNHVNVAR